MTTDFVELALSDPDGVVDAIIEQHELYLGDVFPGLRGLDEVIRQDDVDVRSHNGLRRAQCPTWSSLAAKSVGDLWQISYLGRLSVQRILAAAAERNVRAYLAGGESFPPPVSVDEADAPTGRATSTGRIVALLQDIAVRLDFDGRAKSVGDMFDVIADGGSTDANLSEAISQLRAVPLADIVDPAVADERRSLAATFIAALGEDRSEIFVERCLHLEGQPTLQELGDRRGVTRERIRQIEVKTLADARSQCEDARFAALSERADELSGLLGPTCLVDDAHTEAAIAAATVGFDEPAVGSTRELLLWIAGPYRLRDGWLVREGADVRAVANEFDTRFAADLFVTPDQIEVFRVDHDLPDLDALLTRVKGWRRLDDGRLARWRGTVADKALVGLTVAGEPMLAEALNSWIAEGHSDGTVRNALAADPRFVRIDKDNRFGLREWGFDDYRGIAEMLRSRIEREGPVALETVASEFAERYRVSENSVRAYAATPAFVIEDGVVRLRRDDEPLVVDARVRDARGVYLDAAQRVIVHLPVDTDVLRGSGRTFPTAASVELGIGIGDSVRFLDPITDIPVAIGWRSNSTTGPTIGSLRLVAEGLGAVDGDTLRLRFDLSDQTYLPEIADVTTLGGATGLEVRPGDERAVVAEAIRSKPGKARKHLKARGDNAVARLIPKD